jgi:hypothetical protein
MLVDPVPARYAKITKVTCYMTYLGVHVTQVLRQVQPNRRGVQSGQMHHQQSAAAVDAQTASACSGFRAVN